MPVPPRWWSTRHLLVAENVGERPHRHTHKHEIALIGPRRALNPLSVSLYGTHNPAYLVFAHLGIKSQIILTSSCQPIQTRLNYTNIDFKEPGFNSAIWFCWRMDRTWQTGLCWCKLLIKCKLYCACKAFSHEWSQRSNFMCFNRHVLCVVRRKKVCTND